MHKADYTEQLLPKWCWRLDWEPMAWKDWDNWGESMFQEAFTRTGKETEWGIKKGNRILLKKENSQRSEERLQIKAY